jgi:acyl dehydratase
VNLSTGPAANYFEDFAVGMTFRSRAIEVSAEQIVRFAGEFDPQPFHLDAHAAHASFFGTLVASGWHTAALTMRLLVESGLSIAGGMIGAGAEIKWPAAMRPGDRVHVEVEVTATRLLRTRTDMGLITTRTLTVNEAGTIVQELVANLFVPRRSAMEGAGAAERVLG